MNTPEGSLPETTRHGEQHSEKLPLQGQAQFLRSLAEQDSNDSTGAESFETEEQVTQEELEADVNALIAALDPGAEAIRHISEQMARVSH